MANDTALLYTDRGHFIEYGVLVREMPRYVRCAYLPQAEILTGHWQTALDQLIAAPDPATRPAVDGAEVAARWPFSRNARPARLPASRLERGGARRTRGAAVYSPARSLPMLSRRSLITSGALAAGALATTRTAEAEQVPSMPAPIAALTSMRGTAKPITRDERKGRVEKARRLMTEQKIDALMLTGGTSLVYFSGIQWGLSERLFSLVIPKSGEPFVVCPAFEEDRAREQFATSPFTGTADVRTWEEHESPYERLAQGLKDRGITTGRLGVEETVRHMFVDGVAKAAPGSRS